MIEHNHDKKVVVPWPELACSLLLLGAVGVLCSQVWARLRFPWDVVVWAESPFLTNMVKLGHGQPLYADPALGNSFVYSPGLEYLTYGLLRPIGLELDIRYCRLVTIALAVAGSMLVGLLCAALSRCPQISRFVVGAIAAEVTLLVLFQNFTADIPHPDNLHVFHALLTLFLTFLAAETRRYSYAVLAVCWAGLGVLAKQTNALAVLVPLCSFALLKCWSRRQVAILVILGTTALSIGLAALWVPKWGKFYTFDLLAAHPRVWSKLAQLPGVLWRTPHRCLLLATVPFAVIGLAKAGQVGRRFLVCWATTGVFVGAPVVSGYLKILGAPNNFVVLDIWMWTGFFSTLVLWSNEGEGKSMSLFRRRLAATLVVVTCLSCAVACWPQRLVASTETRRYCENLQALIDDDHRAGRKVLVAHGTSFLLRAGYEDVPIDRGNSLLELALGKQDARSTLPSRLAAGVYDRIYLNNDWIYPRWVKSEIVRYYRAERTIPLARPVNEDFATGWQSNIIQNAVVFVRKEKEGDVGAKGARAATAAGR